MRFDEHIRLGGHSIASDDASESDEQLDGITHLEIGNTIADEHCTSSITRQFSDHRALALRLHIVPD